MTTEREQRDRVQGIPIWQRENGIWYADFRRFRHGTRTSLKTRDRTEAEERLAERKRELEEAEDQQLDSVPDPPLTDYFQTYLDRRSNEVAPSTWSNEERALGYLATWLKRDLGRQAHLSDVTVASLRRFKADQLQKVKPSTFNVRLTGISQVLQRAFEEGLVPSNEAKRLRRPKVNHAEEVWLEPDEAVRVLGAAKVMERDPASRCYPYLHALVATFLLTGGRRSEVLGLEVDDIEFDHDEIAIRPNQWRGLKTRQSQRRVPLWPQLKKILKEHCARVGSEASLLFPAPAGGMLTTLRWALRTLESRSKVTKHLTLKVFRHTYTAARIQTLDQGAPISLYTVARELGHKGVGRIEDTYGHLQRRRSRAEEVRYENPQTSSSGQSEDAVSEPTD